MPRSGAGVYTLPALNPVVGGTIITSAWANNTMNDVAAALTASIASNGVTPITANLIMSGFRHTGVSAAAAFNDYARADQVQELSLNVLTGVGASGTPTAYTATLPFNQSTSRAFGNKQMVIFTPNVVSVGAATLNVNGSGALPIVGPDGTGLWSPLVAGANYILIYTGAAWAMDNFNLLNASVKNWMMNPSCEVAQRITTVPKAISTAQQYGSVDRYKVGAITGTVSAGTIIQSTAAPLGRTGYALQIAGLTTAGGGNIAVDQFIESRDAVNLKNATVSFQCRVYQDIFTPIAYQVFIDKANAQDNFGAVTNIGTSGVTGATINTDTLVTFSGVALGDCSNGLRIRVVCSSLNGGPKNLYFTDFSLTESVTILPFTYSNFTEELWKCQRYFFKTFNYQVNIAQASSALGSFQWSCVKAGATAQFSAANFKYPRPLGPNIPSLTFYSIAFATANVYDFTTGSDSGAAGSVDNAANGFLMSYTGVAAGAVGNRHAVHITADADF